MPLISISICLVFFILGLATFITSFLISAALEVNFIISSLSFCISFLSCESSESSVLSYFCSFFTGDFFTSFFKELFIQFCCLFSFYSAFNIVLHYQPVLSNFHSFPSGASGGTALISFLSNLTGLALD